MIYGIGTDIEKISTIGKLIENTRFVQRFFHESEIAEFEQRKMSAQSVTSAFCAKEAFFKSVGTGIDSSMKNVCLLHTQNGSPYIKLRGETAEKYVDYRFHVSISHAGDNAVATVICEEKKR